MDPDVMDEEQAVAQERHEHEQRPRPRARERLRVTVGIAPGERAAEATEGAVGREDQAHECGERGEGREQRLASATVALVVAAQETTRGEDGEHRRVPGHVLRRRRAARREGLEHDEQEERELERASTQDEGQGGESGAVEEGSLQGGRAPSDHRGRGRSETERCDGESREAVRPGPDRGDEDPCERHDLEDEHHAWCPAHAP
jgi:hypothetical protein